MKYILILCLLTSCFPKAQMPQIPIDKPNNDTIYKELIKEVGYPVEKLVYSNCNDTAYLMTISALNRALDSAKTTKEKRIITKQIKTILDDRNDRELKEQKEANKLALKTIQEQTDRIGILQKALKEMEKSNRVASRQQNNCSHWTCWIIIGILALIIIGLLRFKI